MPQPRPDPVAAADAAARAQAHVMLRQARHASLAYLDPETGTPGISRIAFGLGPEGGPERGPVTLISALAAHSAALRNTAACAVMLGEVGDKGDPLTHPRLMIRAEAVFVAAEDPIRPDLRAHWLQGHPKAALYIDFADFAFVRLRPVSALLNAGFGRAFQLTAEELRA